MSLNALTAKRVRRTWEPEEKAWDDAALELPWEEVRPPLHKASIFALKNVFFFSHATPVQALALKVLTQSGASGMVEAPTGSGKTLAFLLPIMERCVRSCEAYVAAHQRPPLSRHILGVVFSPSRTLAEQTFVVGRNLAARYPFHIQFLLCDGVVQKPAAVVQHLRRGARGAGTFLVTTPKDFEELLPLIEGTTKGAADSLDERREALLAQQDEATRQRYLARRQKMAAEDDNAARDDETVRFYSTPDCRFVVVMDEADLLYNSPDMRQTVETFVETHRHRFEPKKKTKRTPKAKKAVKGGGSSTNGAEKRMEALSTSSFTPQSGAGFLMDFAFVGATVATSPLLKNYAERVCRECGTTLHTLALRSNDDFISQLNNRYVVCDATNFLPYLVQLMNLHASKKHFVFFNNFRVLLFVQRLFAALSEGKRPLLYIPNVYVMYEGMSEGARIDQYNKFLTHVSRSGETRKPKKALSDAEKKNQIFTGGWKRDGSVNMGTGAILLCTDIAAFGLDVRDVDYVYHFEPPATVQSYIHRVGRVGRMGMKGTSILLLPCNTASDNIQTSRERKTGSTRFNTVTNTKHPTGKLQSLRITSDSLPEERRLYLKELSEHSRLEEYNIPPFAPITSTLRNMIKQDERILKVAKRAAIAMCEITKNGAEPSWFTPKLAMRALLLD